jgi:hypothetical protein
MAAGKKKSGSTALAERENAIAAQNGDALDAALPYVGQWNRLVSTTNWEKGRIICQWRDALIAAGAAVTDYSDETWSQLVGGVTSQHVGRLRRVFQRFGEASDQYEGLYWSHFQASLDWEDAEMWLEGAIHNGWSVSQMRGKRWETVGKPGEAMPTDEGDGEQAVDEDAPWLSDETSSDETAAPATDESAEVQAVEGPAKRGKDDRDDDDNETSERSSSNSDDYEAPKTSPKSRSRLGVEVDELPEDIADAFEQFKLAIIAQRRLGWSETTPEAVLECLDALRDLALAPADD